VKNSKEEDEMKRIFLTLFAIAGVALAGMKTYTVSLLEPAMLGGTELKAGDYQLQVDGVKVIIHSGKTTAEATMKTETNGSKYSDTTVRMNESGGKRHITEIRLGGTNMKLVFGE
jgi:hypothetical protein